VGTEVSETRQEMILPDANLVLYSYDLESPLHMEPLRKRLCREN
jgi:hypothetical protein